MSDMLMKNFLAATGLGREDTMYLLKPLQGLLRKLVLHAVLLDIVDQSRKDRLKLLSRHGHPDNV